MKALSAVREQFAQDGFVVHADAGLPISLLENARNRVGHILNREYETGAKPWSYFGDKTKELTRVAQIHLTDTALLKLITHPSIGQLAAQLTGAKTIKVWGCQLFYKPAGSKDLGNVGFHRDSEHMPFFKGGVLTGWLPLTPIGDDNGPLTVINGSHKWCKDQQHTGGEIQNLEQQTKLLQSKHADEIWQQSTMTMPLGGMSFHDYDLLHGSFPNTTATDRCAISLGLMTEAAEVDPSVEDYGYALVLNDERFCPTIYRADT